MNNTIPNVPRELYTCIGKGGEYEYLGLSAGAGMARGEQRQVYRCTATGRVFHRECMDFKERMERLSAPSPAGVDGCKCSMSISMLGDGCRHCQPQEYIDRIGEMLDEERSELSDAQAIIGGLRGEVASLENRRLDANAQVGNTRFGVGIKERTVIDAAKRYAEYMAQPEQEADRIAKGAEFLAALQAPAQAIALRTERDQLTQRIGELASHLEFAVTMLTVAGLAGNAQVEAMRSAMSAGKDGE